MTDRELVKKLNNLKNLQPDENWRQSNREILFSQVTNSSLDSEVSPLGNFWIGCQNFFATVSQPALVVSSLMVLLLVGAVFTHRLINVRPTNSLYIAKIVSEEANLSVIFNSDEKNKMALQFATGHAQDIANTLADPSFNTDQNKVEVARLNENFKTALDKVRTLANVTTPNANDDMVFTADSGKTNTGLSVYSPSDAKNQTNPSVNNQPLKTPVAVKQPTTSVATSAANCATSTADLKIDATQSLNDAQKLFDAKDYSGALDKLKQVDNSLK